MCIPFVHSNDFRSIPKNPSKKPQALYLREMFHLIHKKCQAAFIAARRYTINRYRKGLSEEVCIHITGNTEIRGIYPHICSRYTIDAGTLYRAAGDLNLLTVLRAFVNYFVLICKARCGTNCKVSALDVLYGSPTAVKIIVISFSA